MAIAFRSVGARLKIDLSTTTNGTQNVALPTGHASGDLLLLFVLTDGNNNVTPDPAGWTRIMWITNRTAVASPYTPCLQLKVYWRIDNGSLGSNVALQFDVTDPWPKGKYEVLAFCAAYTGADPTAPIGEWSFQTTVNTSTALIHPQLTTSRANDWLLTYRAVVSDAPAATYTTNVGTDVERVDDADNIAETSCALYDSNAALAAGLQTQRTTTASRAATYGSLGISLAIQPPAPVNAATANATVASGTAVAVGASPQAVSGPWSTCDVGGLPTYSLAVDWGSDGSLRRSGTVVGPNPWFRTDTVGWNPSNSTISRVGIPNQFGFPVAHVVPVGGQASGGINADRTALGTIVPGRSYLAEMWVYSPKGWSDLRPCVDWYDGSGTFISSGLGSGTAVPAGKWTKIQQTLVAPAGASAAVMRGRFGSTPSSTDDWYVWGLLLVDPTTGTFSGPDIGGDLTCKVISDISFSYGRDQQRQLNPAAVGSAAFSVINADRTFSPDFVNSVLYGDLEPAQQAQALVSFGGKTYPLFWAKIDDFTIKADRSDRTVDFTFLDGLADLQNVKLSTPVCKAQRTGALINNILDMAGFTGPRDIDLGATVVPYWWAEGTDALSAITDLVKSEGPPAVFYQAPDGTMTFRDRHHRLLRSQSTTVQATFAQPDLMDCSPDPMPEDSYQFTAPFQYAHGWRDIVNSVSFDVSERLESANLSVVWSSDSTISIASGQSVTIQASTTDPFMDAVVPVQGTDYTTSGNGVLTVSMDRTSGQAVRLTLLATSGSVSVLSLQLRAKTISVQRTVKVQRDDPQSIALHGEKDYPDQAPWANANDADAIAGMILLHYARRRPIVQLRIVSADPSHWVQAITRTVSDRIHIRYDEMGIDDDFFVEKITHTLRRYNQPGLPPVHEVVLGCERDLQGVVNPFTFDKRGAGFDQGVFDYIQTDKTSSVFIFDHPTQGQFDVGLYGT